ncbi:NAD(P)/FAD-dependent oxidoreductase [Hoeflea alexandrii]|uniref:NAD(P)/FAD-dependent oxidoreductase n=1 Tax=Hoeflea alexandrii TaxID=288436 RepID=UPI0022AEB444|nr:FAD-dependent oxidoreductase [Hoeflea alexandrii]MCZ4291640.1 FAD-dependent oxidoreductase [Hoeflea alexandrii]
MVNIDATMRGVHWAAISKEAPFTEDSSNQKAEYDIAVVGGGFCGLSIALHAASAGRSVVLLEAGTIGCGASGRNGGIVVPHFPGAMTADDVVQVLGRERGERLAKLVADGPGFVFDQIRELGIACDGEQNGWLQPAHSEKSLAKVRRVHESWVARGVDAEWIDAQGVAEMTGASGYLGGWHRKSGGTVNPYALAQGLARVARERGADIRQHVVVGSILKDGAAQVLSTSVGEFRARKVVIATNAHTPSLYPGLAQSVIPVLLFHGFTRPLDDAEKRTVLPTRVCFTDLRKSGGFSRLSSDDRVIIGGAIFRPSNHRAYSEWHSARRLAELFPHLGGIHVESFWEGWCALTDAYLPAIQRLEPNVYSVIGFSTRGVALAQTLGREFAQFLCENKTETEMPVRVGPVLPISMQPIKAFLGGFAFPAYQLRDALRLT